MITPTKHTVPSPITQLLPDGNQSKMLQLQKMLIVKRTYLDIPLFWLHSSKGTPNFVRQKVTNLPILNFNFLSNVIGYINPSMRQSSSSTIFDDTMLRPVIRTYEHIQ